MKTKISERLCEDVVLVPVGEQDYDDFVKRNQAAFNKAVKEADPDFKGNIISRKQIISSLTEPTADAYNVYFKGEKAGGVITSYDKAARRASLDILFTDPSAQGKGLGFTIWKKIENSYPDAEAWETLTPYFEKRNLHFYINKCGFRMVEFYNASHPEPFPPDDSEHCGANVPSEFCRFEKPINKPVQ